MTLTSKCPVCGKILEDGQKFRPFCSERCSQIDLGRWLTESYVVPAAPVDDEAEES